MNSTSESRAPADVERAVLHEQVDLLYRQSVPAAILTVVNATVLAVVLLEVIDAEQLIAWYTLVVAVTLGRTLLTARYRARAETASDIERWRDRYAIGAGLGGACWGLAGTWLFPSASPVHQIITLIIIAGVSAGAVNFQASVLRVYVAYVVMALVPLAIWLFFQETSTHAFIGFVTLVFLASLIVTSRRTHLTLVESLRLRFENADLIRDLGKSKRELQQANRRLQGEIAEHTRTENELRDSYQFLKRIMDNTTNAIYVLDLQGRFIHTNHVLSSITGYRRDELMERPIGLLFDDEDIGAMNERLERVSRHGEPVHQFEANVRRRGHERRTLSFNLAPLYEGEKISAIVGTADDVTERRKIDRLKSEFLSTVSHELRTPLTSIRGSLGLLHGGVRALGSAEAQSLIEIAYKNTDRLINLINDLLDIQKLEAGEMQFKFVVRDLRDLVAHALTVNRGFAEEYGVKLQCSPLPAGMEVRVDTDRFEQVLTNLLSNAVKFSPPGASVEVGIHRLAEGVRVSITDQGEGIPEDFRDRVFQKFAQADSSSTRRKGGTGLGLSISKGMIERMGGHIGFTSEEGVGTTFFIDLPLAD